MTKYGSDVILIMRNVTGRIDASDPLFDDSVMLGYANDFLNLIMPQEVRLYENKTWWEFTIDENEEDPFQVNLQDLKFTTIGPPAYVDGFELEWHQNPDIFFTKWPETQTYDAQRPEDVLYYDNELIFRGPLDQEYDFKFSAYKVEAQMVNSSNEADPNTALEFDYFWRYVAYGASLDIFSDYGEMDNYQRYYPVFRRYRSLVYSRTNQQLMSQRALPTF